MSGEAAIQSWSKADAMLTFDTTKKWRNILATRKNSRNAINKIFGEIEQLQTGHAENTSWQCWQTIVLQETDEARCVNMIL